MVLPLKSRRYTTPVTWCALALGIAIVLWGASYKMEQYPHQGRACRVMSPAKLLTEKERPLRQGGLSAAIRVASVPSQNTYASAWRLTFRSAILFFRQHEIPLPAARAGFILKAQHTYFSFRPPPSLLSS